MCHTFTHLPPELKQEWVSPHVTCSHMLFWRCYEKRLTADLRSALLSLHTVWSVICSFIPQHCASALCMTSGCFPRWRVKLNLLAFKLGHLLVMRDAPRSRTIIISEKFNLKRIWTMCSWLFCHSEKLKSWNKICWWIQHWRVLLLFTELVWSKPEKSH